MRARTITLAPTATRASSDARVQAEGSHAAGGSQPLHDQPRVENTTTWRECAQRTPRNDRWRCSLDASGRTRGRVLAEGLPPVFGLHDTATADEAADSWIVVMDNEIVSRDDILKLCDPAVSGVCVVWDVARGPI